MLQQPLARRVAGAARYAAAGERCQGHCLCRVCGVAHEACELQSFHQMERRDGPRRRAAARNRERFIARESTTVPLFPYTCGSSNSLLLVAFFLCGSSIAHP